MSNILSISKPVWTDNPAHPSKPGSTYSAAINVKNQRHISLENIDGSRWSLRMTVRDPYSLGLKSGEQIDLDDFFDGVLTACNLLLKEARLSIGTADTSLVDVSLDQPQDDVQVENRDGNVEVTARLNGGVRFSVKAELRGKDEIDEAQVREVLNMIHAVHAVKNLTIKTISD